MNRVLRTFCVVSLTMAVPSIVFAQSNTAFDGTYAGVSNTAAAGGPDCDPLEPAPRPLTVSNSMAWVSGGWFTSGDVAFKGSVSPQGDFNIADMFADNLIGKIDPSGTATGSFSVGDTGCVLTAIWQKQ
jgi:hypothetical protein